jgi:hypothetical protein
MAKLLLIKITEKLLLTRSQEALLRKEIELLGALFCHQHTLYTGFQRHLCSTVQ